MKKTPAAERIAEACLGIIRRSDQIVALAETPDAELSRIFSGKEIRVTSGICCELALAVADSESVVDLAANRENFERMRGHVMAANEALAERTTVNPQTMSAIMNAEDTLINLLVAADPTVRLMAGFAKKYLGVVKSTLTAFFTDLRKTVAGFAKPGKDGQEKAWNSICQQAKVLDERLMDEERLGK